MISKEKAYSDFLVECRAHKEQQESYRISLQNENIYSVTDPCCPRSFSDCFENYYKSLMKYLEGEEFDWECTLEGSKVYYTKGKDEYVSIEYVRAKCKELGICLD